MAQAQKKRPFLWIIVILLFVGLLGFGTGGLDGTIRSIGTAGGKDISIVAYRTQLNNQIRAFSNQIGSPLSFQQAQSMGLDQAVLQQVITQRSLENEAAELGLSVGDAQVAERVQAIPNVRALDGTFDREAYAEALRRVGETESQYEESIRDEVSRSLLQAAVASGLPAPETYANALVQYVGETRDITLARLTADDLTIPFPGPTEADITTYYTDNSGQFMRPERRDITYVWLTPAMIQDQLEIDEDALRALYDERIRQFVQPERRLVERLAFIDSAAAQEAADRLTAGEVDFEALVAERGLDLSDVDMGDVAQDDLDGAGEAVFAATPGEVVGPLPSSLGPALFRINAVLAAEETPFEDARADLREELATQRAIRVIDQASESINDLIAGGATLTDLAERTDLELGTIAFDADTAEGIAAYDSFRDAAATAQMGDFATLLPLSDGGIFALQLDGITPPQQRPLDEVRESVIAGWTAATTQSILLSFAEGRAAELAPLTDFATAGLSPVEQDGLLRNSFVEGTPPGFMEQIFEMDVTEIRVIDAADAALIVRLDRSAPPDPQDPQDPQTQAQLEQINNAATAGIAQDVFEAYAASVQARTEVTLNQAAINAVHTQMQ